MPAQNERDTRRELIRIAAPVAGVSLFNTFMHAIDARMVSVLGISKIAAVSLTNTPRLLIFSLFFSFNTATNILLARAIGDGDRKGACGIVRNGLAAVLAFSILLGALAASLSRPILSVFANQADTIGDSSSYFSITMLFSFVYLAGAFMNSCNVCSGRPRSVFYSNVAANLVNVLFNYLLIDGHLGFPALGVLGAAVATVIGNACGTLVSAVCLLKSFPLRELKAAGRPLLSGLGNYAGIWGNIALSGVTERVSYFILAIINARVGSYVYSVYSVGMYFLNVNFAVGNGLSTACLTLIGKASEDRAKTGACLRAFRRVIVCAAACLVLLWLVCGRSVFALYSREPDFIRMGTVSVAFFLLITPLHILSLSLQGILNSLKDSAYVARVSLLSTLVIYCGVCWLMNGVLHTGIIGIWAGCLCSYLFSGGAYLRRCSRKKREAGSSAVRA